MREVGNLNEFFVHHEDVRRANGFGPRTNPPAEDARSSETLAVCPGFYRAGCVARGSTSCGPERTRSSEREGGNRPFA